MGPMTDRLHAWLDGELPLDALTEQERADALALEATIAAAAARFRDVPVPDLTGRVMAALPAVEAQSRAVQAGAWSRFRCWAGSLVPAGGFGPRPAAALAALSLVIGFGLGTLVSVVPPSEPEAEPQMFVRFELEASGAAEVRLAGSFSDWEATHELTQVGPDRWTVTVALEPGVHDYVFVVDGHRHVVDPYAPRVADGFGGFNSRLALLAPEP
jgi:hypothetical protein